MHRVRVEGVWPGYAGLLSRRNRAGLFFYAVFGWWNRTCRMLYLGTATVQPDRA
jgi:hypothetical protein